MNIFHCLTRRALAKNRTRTLVTIIGITLSMALFTAVIQGAHSGLDYLARNEIASVGAYHGFYPSLTDSELSALESDGEVREVAEWRTVGWANIGSENEYKPYLLVKSMGDSFTDLVSVRVLSGRLPENAGEIALPAHLANNGGVVIPLGETISLDLGARVSESGEALPERSEYASGERLQNTSAKKYTVVGFYARLDSSLEAIACPGYVALTKGEASGAPGAAFTVKHPARFYSFMAENAVAEGWVAHRELLLYSGSAAHSSIKMMMYGFAGILVFLIAFGSISLIYNSFAISVSERTRQFGILKSVGATRKQIRESVRYEALILCAIAIPLGTLIGCLGIGVTLYCLRDSFSFLDARGTGVQMRLSIAPSGILVAAAACLLTTLISARIPARRALAVSPIESIRQTDDVKIRSRDVRVSPLSKLFGFEGLLAAKNFGRNRRRYRSTVFSLFLSVALFISASAFSSYLTDVAGGLGTQMANDIQYHVFGDAAERLDGEATLQMLKKARGVTDGVYYHYVPATLLADANLYADSMLRVYDIDAETASVYGVGATAYFIDEDAFRALCEANALDADAYLNAETPVAIAFNHPSTIMESGNSKKLVDYDVFKSSALPITVTRREWVELPDYYQTGEVEGENGEILYRYETADGSDVKLLTRDEAFRNTPMVIGALISEAPYFVGDPSSVALIYPMSMENAVNIASEPSTWFKFTTDSHAETYSDMQTMLTESGLPTASLYDRMEENEAGLRLITVINVFSLGFIILISLIAMTNVFNTISTSIALRRREFAMLKSVGLTHRGFDRMMNYECLIYGVRSLLFGVPAGILMSYAIYNIANIGYASARGFYMPWHSVAIGIGSVFVVVFATMLYSTHRIRRDNPIDALKNENL